MLVDVHPGQGVSLVDVSSAPATLEPGQQAQMLVTVACTGAFSLQALSSLSVSYHLSDAQRVAVTLQLPALATKFLVPAPAVENAQFNSAWRALSGPPNK